MLSVLKIGPEQKIVQLNISQIIFNTTLKVIFWHSTFRKIKERKIWNESEEALRQKSDICFIFHYLVFYKFSNTFNNDIFIKVYIFQKFMLFYFYFKEYRLCKKLRKLVKYF